MKIKKHSTLINNTLMLYILIFSNYFFGFITVPYQTRILGPEYYGKLGFATAFTVYFQLFLDFGFILSATAEVAKHRNNKEKLSKIMSSVVIAKILLMITSFLLLLILCLSIPKLKEDAWLYILFFIYVSINSMLPDYLYRGLENMKIITYRTVTVKLFFTIMVFVFLKEKSQYYYVPILNIIGSTGAVITVYAHVLHKLKIKFVRVDSTYIWETLKNSSYYFYSRIATSIYDATNTFILGFLYPTGNIVGYFTSSNKLVTTARSAFSPIADSLYPHMIKSRDYKLIKKILIIFMPIIIGGCIIVSIFAEPICILLFGDEFKNTAPILRLLLPLIALALPNYLLGFPTLTPLGLAKYANISTILGAIIQVVGLIILYIISILNVYTICILTCVTEFCVLLIRVWAILVKGRNQFSLSSGHDRI
ncbi:oligosaccharide flippase family protein [Irregularibacter muris]|uniref:Oligosaccharide flippase family protein n=1 Tax=Irregularibacter muris TaxID=1796619 RepID=A0AAE3HG96_9FIRM|nr:oligosaccharide flippase family protein [Irregularibacter muris]MCR1900081.1 oligosaccharide flippase family protein [Irregularibacter muris]